jgi:hypothetical protein
MDNDALIRVLFAELIDELGGIVRLDAIKILADIKENKFKEIGLRIEGDVATVEVFDEDEN